MTAPKTKNGISYNQLTTDKGMQPVKTVQIIIFACTNCGEEIEHVQLCNECKAPMKIVQVLEKYGEEAESFIQNLQSNGSLAVVVEDQANDSASVVIDNGILNNPDLDADVEDSELDSDLIAFVEENAFDASIFPDDGDSIGEPKADISDLLDTLDKEEEVPEFVGDDMEQLPEL